MTTTAAPASRTIAPRWWEEPEYAQGELVLPGQSRLAPEERRLLEDIGSRAEKGLLEIPPMPKAALEATRILRSADAEVADVAKCIQLDPVLTALVLRQANSALYGPRHTIDTVSQAVSYLGMRRMKDVVLGAAMKRVTGDVKAKTWAEMEWRYAIHCAAIARSLARNLRLDEEQCYVAGLLHDIGRLPVLQALDARGALPARPEADVAADIILEALHRGVGLQVAEKWEQPPSVRDAVSKHLTGRLKDEDDLSQFASTRVAEAAGDLCVALGLGRFRRPFAVLEAPSLRALGLADSVLKDWLDTELPKVVADVSTIL